ncbi:MAG: T9SS type A sorting domain-containing protein [bacterium]
MKFHNLIFVFILLAFTSDTHAQGAFDSACYFSHMGDPNELDTIYGGVADQGLGSNVGHFPPLKGEKYDRLVMQGLPENIPFLTSVKTGPSFRLHALNILKRYRDFSNLPTYIFGHFHTPEMLDMLVYQNDGSAFINATIYWADENDDFDSTHYTQVIPFDSRHLTPFVGKLTNDSVDDILMGVDNIHYSTGQFDTSYIALIKGGQQLYDKGIVASWDDTVIWAIPPYQGLHIDSMKRGIYQGDWRGTGRQDILTVDYWGNFFYYKNAPGFDLHKFVNSMKYDTILVASDWNLYRDYHTSGGNGVPMRAFPKSPGDRSVDLLCPLPISTSTSSGASKNGICIFRGGPDFGSKRLSYNNPDYFIHSPAFYSGDFAKDNWPGPMHDFGDLTGTGNAVLGTGGGFFTFQFTALYVLGKALDDKIDVFFSQNEGGYGGEDTIHIIADGRTTYIMGAPAYQSPEDQANGIFAKGSLLVLNGSEKIPVRLNPLFASVERHSLDTNHLLAYPNPCDESTVLTFDNCTGDKMIIDVLSTSGEYCQHEETPAGFGLQQYGLSLTSLPAGIYIVRLSCISDGWTALVKIMKTGAAIEPWHFDLHKMMGR